MKSRVKVLLMIAAVVATCLCGPQLAVAVTLFGAEAADRGSDLFIIDPATGAGTLVGNLGGPAITGLAVHPFTGVLYGATASIAVPAGSLVTIDTTTAAATLVGGFGFSTLADLSFDPLTGTLYGWRSRSEGDLYTVDLTTGAATLVGESGLSSSGGNGLAFDESGKLYFAGDGTEGVLRTVDKMTGLTTDLVTLFGYTENVNISSLAFDGPTLYGVTQAVRDHPDLITIDIATGQITTIGLAAGSDAVDAIAFTLRPTAVPEPSTLALTLVGLTAVGLLLRRRLTVRTSSCDGD